jgi:isopenicillin N synthase-like dioxygenase
VKNHSVPEKVVSDVFEQSHDFFALPSETKRTVRCSSWQEHPAEMSDWLIGGHLQVWRELPRLHGSSVGEQRPVSTHLFDRGKGAGVLSWSGPDGRSTKQGELHEAFNLGLDPSLDAASHDEQTKSQGELVHSDNLWPAEGDWKQAAAFVSGSRDHRLRT